mgnify:CR=1 FL=1
MERQPLADHSHHRAAQLDQRDPHRCHPPGRARAAGETAPILFTGAPSLRGGSRPRHPRLLPYWHLGSLHGAVAITCSSCIDAGNRRIRRPIYGTAMVLFGIVLTVNLLSIALRVYLAVAEEVVAPGRPTLRSGTVTRATDRRSCCATSRSTSWARDLVGIIGPRQFREDDAADSASTGRLISCPVPPSRASVRIDGQMSAPATYQLRRQIGMVFPLPVGSAAVDRDNVARRRAWPACATAPHWTRWSRNASAGGALGRSQGSHAHAGHQAVRRPAAAADDRPRAVASAGDPTPRRVLDRRGPGDHHEDRGRLLEDSSARKSRSCW